MDNKRHILICDDERDVADLVAHLLAREGFATTVCHNGSSALKLLAKRPFDLVVLDIMMPGMDGFEVCRRMRLSSDARIADIPVVFLSAKGEEVDKVIGFTIGADDYVTKPFKPRELAVRVKARLRRRDRPERAANTLHAQDIEVDETLHTACLHGTPLSLTPKEFDCLTALLKAGGMPVPVRDLFERVWRAEYTPSSRNTVMVHVRRLRKKLAEIDSSEEFIETVWGVGYRIGKAAAKTRAERPGPEDDRSTP